MFLALSFEDNHVIILTLTKTLKQLSVKYIRMLFLYFHICLATTKIADELDITNKAVSKMKKLC